MAKAKKEEKIIQDQELEKVAGGFPTTKHYLHRYCPECFSTNVTYSAKYNGCTYEAIFKCRDCGHEWKG